MSEDYLPQVHEQLIEFDTRHLKVMTIQCDPSDVVNWLKWFSVTGIIAVACEKARVSRYTISKLRRECPAFKDAFMHAKRNANDYLEAEAYRRGVTGVPDTDKKRYSDRLLQTLLKANHPRYKTQPKVVANINNEANANAASVDVTVGPPVPQTGDMSEWAGKFAEIAAEQNEREQHETNGHETNGNS